MFFKSKAVRIKLTKQQKKDKNFILPPLCIYCGSPHVHYSVELYNQYEPVSRIVVRVILAIMLNIFYFMLLHWLTKGKQESYPAYVCQQCQSFVEQRRKALKWLNIKMIIIFFITTLLGSLAIKAFASEEYIAPDTLLTLIFVYLFVWLIGSYLYSRQFEMNIRKHCQLRQTSLAPKLVITDLRIFPVGILNWKRFRMTATIHNIDYLQELIRRNQTQCTIHCRPRQLHKLKQLEEFTLSTEHLDDMRLLNFIYTHWPVVQTFVPESVVPVFRGFGVNDGICSHPEFADNAWVHSRGGERFTLQATPPDNFFWMGIQNRGGSEYFFLMWYRSQRRFWFYDQCVMYYAQGSASPERTLNRLNSALERWALTTTDVIYSGPWGWFDPKTQKGNLNKSNLDLLKEKLTNGNQ